MTDSLKTTKKDKYNAIIHILNTVAPSEEISDLKDFCSKEIDSLNKKSEKAKANRKSKPKADTDELAMAVAAVLTDELATIADITSKIDNENATTAKVGYRLRAMEKAGTAIKEQVTIPGTDGAKSRKVVAYKKA